MIILRINVHDTDHEASDKNVMCATHIRQDQGKLLREQAVKLLEEGMKERATI